MLKRIVVALAGLFAMLALAVAPASGTETTLDMFSQTDGEGTKVSVPSVPTECTTTPLSEVGSAHNQTSTAVRFFWDTNCEGASQLVPANGTEPIDTVDGAGNGAIRYEAAE